MVPIATTRTVEIRPMRERDVDEVAGIETQWHTRPWPAGLFSKELEREDRVYLVATGPRASFRRAPIVAYAGALVAGSEAHVLTVAVDEAHRRQGIGRALVTALVKAVRARGAVGVTLEVRESNDSALALYERLGFVSYGLRPGYYQDNGEAARILWLHDDAPGAAAAAGRE